MGFGRREERGSGKKNRERERVERKQLHRQTNELFAAEFTATSADAEIAREGERGTMNAKFYNAVKYQQSPTAPPAKLLHFPGLFVIDARRIIGIFAFKQICSAAQVISARPPVSWPWPAHARARCVCRAVCRSRFLLRYVNWGWH